MFPGSCASFVASVSPRTGAGKEQEGLEKKEYYLAFKIVAVRWFTFLLQSCTEALPYDTSPTANLLWWWACGIATSKLQKAHRMQLQACICIFGLHSEWVGCGREKSQQQHLCIGKQIWYGIYREFCSDSLFGSVQQDFVELLSAQSC